MTAISLTTIPSRIDHIKPCIDSLLRQGFPVYVWVPEYCRRTGDDLDGIPGFLYRDGIRVATVEDRGPITKLLPALECGFDRVLTADDDHVYGDGWADELVAYSDEHPAQAVAYRGRVFRGRKYNETDLIAGPDGPKEVEFITGVKGALYRREFFDKSIFEEWKSWLHNDDIVISAHLKKRGVRMTVIPRPCEIKHYSVASVDNLWDDGNGRRNDEGLEKVYW